MGGRVLRRAGGSPDYSRRSLRTARPTGAIVHGVAMGHARFGACAVTDFDVRDVNVAEDTIALLNLDTSFSSDHIFQVDGPQDGAIRLKSVAVPEPITLQLPFLMEAEPWQRGWVATRGHDIAGFMAVEYRAWNRRLVIWHLYVDRPHRRAGAGNALMDRAIGHGRELGATTAWLETSNLNGVGIEAYRKMGFDICGFDLTHYRGTQSEGQFAVFLSRSIE
jgi:ribosomal protein S18 acetylase RimI-like enzyme